MKKYTAQALAIVLIVLVIASIIGLAMFSRVMKDNLRVIDEKSSAEALEISNSVISAVKGISVEDIKNACTNPQYGEGVDSTNGCTVTGVSTATQFFTSLGVSYNPAESFSNCSSAVSSLDINIKKAGPEDELEIREDNVRSIVLRGQTPSPSSCTMNVTVENKGNEVTGLLVSKIYGKTYANGVAGEYKPYSFDDTLSYCIHSGSDCSSDSRFSSEWIAVSNGSTFSIPLIGIDTYLLDEIRIRAVGGTVGIKTSLSNTDCIRNWEMIKMTVGANCTQSYRAKEIQIPQQESALSIFDYAIFNGNGVLQSE